MTTNKNLFLIHGAWCSKHSFNYIINKVLDESPIGKIYCFEYDCQSESMEDIIARARKELKNVCSNGLETVVVGHSLGGLIALSLSQSKGVCSTITMASPLSGIKYSPWLYALLRWHSPVIRHITPDSSFILNLQSKNYFIKPDIHILVATEGFNPMIYEPSDGVITIDTQTKWVPQPATVYSVPVNHNEILQSPQAILTIQRTLEKRKQVKIITVNEEVNIHV